MNIDKVICISFCVLFGSTIVNNGVFVSPFEFSHYLYLIISSILATLCGIKLWHLKNLTLAYPLPIILFISYVIWYIAQGNFAIHNALNNLHWFLIGNLLILLVYWILPFLGNFKLLHLSRVTTLLVVLEAFVCYFQNFGWVKADTNSFNASGTLVSVRRYSPTGP